MKKWLAGAVLGMCAWQAQAAVEPAAVEPAAVVRTYADIAQAGYEDSHASAQALARAIDALIAQPTEPALAAARQAWIAARVPYMQTEAFRFANPIVDDWEGGVNAWPLDEGLIDYVDASYGTTSDANDYYVVNVIAHPELRVGGKVIDASRIDAELLRDTLHEIGGNEANVATGYHAIEFLLWGQDLNGTGPGAGKRPATDFDPKNCTGGNCERRAQYLKTVADLLVDDLQDMAQQWAPGGAARRAVADKPAGEALAGMLHGLGSLSYGELAGERMKLGLMLHDPEEEHDCFSDNTHNAHYYDQLGISNVYTGSYRRIDGSTVSGPSLAALVKDKDAGLDAEMRERLQASLARLQAIRDSAQAGEHYDQLIAAGNAKGNALVQGAIDALVEQARSIERVVSTLALGDADFEGSDSLDSPQSVFQ